MERMCALLCVVLLCVGVGCSQASPENDGTPEDVGPVPRPEPRVDATPTTSPTPTVPHSTMLEIVDRIPRSGWSEGIDIVDGRIWHAWPSTIRELDMEGNVLSEHEPPSSYSESLTWFRGRLWNLSYHNPNLYAGRLVDGVISFEIVGTVPGVAGWGITHNGTELITTGNGSTDLHFFDGETVSLLRTVTTPVDDLEDLAWDGRYIWASSYSEYPGQVFRLDPTTGAVVDVHSLPDPEECSIVDGIAIDAGRLFVTGKRCPFIYVAPLPPE